MIVDIGGGSTEIAVISLGGIVSNNSIRIAGDDLTADIQEYMSRQHNVKVSERMAERIKIHVPVPFFAMLSTDRTIRVTWPASGTGLNEKRTEHSVFKRKKRKIAVTDHTARTRNTKKKRRLPVGESSRQKENRSDISVRAF